VLAGLWGLERCALNRQRLLVYTQIRTEGEKEAGRIDDTASAKHVQSTRDLTDGIQDVTNLLSARQARLTSTEVDTACLHEGSTDLCPPAPRCASARGQTRQPLCLRDPGTQCVLTMMAGGIHQSLQLTIDFQIDEKMMIHKTPS
jgi:hypothetical protein